MTRAVPGRVRLYACIAAANHGTTAARIFGHTRNASDIQARRELWSRLYNDGFNTTQIGRWTDRHHTTVAYALDRLSSKPSKARWMA